MHKTPLKILNFTESYSLNSFTAYSAIFVSDSDVGKYLRPNIGITAMSWNGLWSKSCYTELVAMHTSPIYALSISEPAVPINKILLQSKLEINIATVAAAAHFPIYDIV